jgi:AcrR family transcriptional regulator
MLIFSSDTTMLTTRISKTRVPMRKEPRQARSRATVQAIVQAGARVLGGRGWAGFNTNEVADAAGVSIGSLYQYFPDKQALVEAIRQRHLDDVLAALPTPLASQMPLAQRVDQLVQGLVAAHSVHPALHRVLLELAPAHSGSSAAQTAFETQYRECYRAIVAASARARGKAATDMMAQVLSATVEGVIHSAARSGSLQSPELKRELVHMVCAYLAPTGPR